MPFDEGLAQRLREALGGRRGLSEQRMFGGLCFLLHGNMLCGVHRERLMFRVGKEQEEEGLSLPGARPMDITGKPMAGFLFVDPEACDEADVARFVTMAARYVGALPAKGEKGRAKATAR